MGYGKLKRKAGTAIHSTVPASVRFHLNEMVTAAVICSAVISTLCPCAYSQSDLRCGDEFRIETQDGTIFQGNLLSNDGNLLALRHGRSGLHTIALVDVASAFRVKRRTGTGMLIGSVFGAGLGFLAAKQWCRSGGEKQCPPGTWFCMDVPIAEIVAIIFSGTLAGGILGGIIGQSIQRLGEVQLEALPMCASPTGNTAPIKIYFAVDF